MSPKQEDAEPSHAKRIVNLARRRLEQNGCIGCDFVLDPEEVRSLSMRDLEKHAAAASLSVCFFDKRDPTLGVWFKWNEQMMNQLFENQES